MKLAYVLLIAPSILTQADKFSEQELWQVDHFVAMYLNLRDNLFCKNRQKRNNKHRDEKSLRMKRNNKYGDKKALRMKREELKDLLPCPFQCLPLPIDKIPKLPNGVPCKSADFCNSGRCNIDLVCADKAKEGEACDPRLDECVEGLYCSTEDKKCAVLGGVGSTCVPALSNCKEGLTCSVPLFKCYHDPRGLGEPCGPTNSCADGLKCSWWPNFKCEKK